MSETHHGDSKRPGETQLETALPDSVGVSFIGLIRTPFKTRDDCPRQGDPEYGPECRLEIDGRLALALAGIEQFDMIEVLYWLHKARRDLLTQSPKADGKTRGTFSLRSPLRPNPIGTSRVRLLARDGNALIVRGLDCLDGTPLLDIKPDRCSYTVQARAKEHD